MEKWKEGSVGVREGRRSENEMYMGLETRPRPQRHACGDEHAVEAPNDGSQIVLDCGSSAQGREKEQRKRSAALIWGQEGGGRRWKDWRGSWGARGRCTGSGRFEWALEREGDVGCTGLAGKRDGRHWAQRARIAAAGGGGDNSGRGRRSRQEAGGGDVGTREWVLGTGRRLRSGAMGGAVSWEMVVLTSARDSSVREGAGDGGPWGRGCEGGWYAKGREWERGRAKARWVPDFEGRCGRCSRGAGEVQAGCGGAAARTGWVPAGVVERGAVGVVVVWEETCGAVMPAVMRRLYSAIECRMRRRVCRGAELGAEVLSKGI
ncbi:hypothetical protein B0H16DRAFT_1696913 [Mycena metata]|uniref:Uncharacterized protein n=1 Tax=Mycena metata TaxID=1033252 RepID=A0AAD7HYZ1_9AGAR|nr:hypothetical protein B0H16DRAFT_1696913 [Mycena metata]